MTVMRGWRCWTLTLHLVLQIRSGTAHVPKVTGTRIFVRQDVCVRKPDSSAQHVILPAWLLIQSSGQPEPLSRLCDVSKKQIIKKKVCLAKNVLFLSGVWHEEPSSVSHVWRVQAGWGQKRRFWALNQNKHMFCNFSRFWHFYLNIVSHF